MSGYVENPEAIGDPDRTPRLRLSPELVRLFNPCEEQSFDGRCGGVNGYHAEGCPKDADQ